MQTNSDTNTIRQVPMDFQSQIPFREQSYARFARVASIISFMSSPFNGPHRSRELTLLAGHIGADSLYKVVSALNLNPQKGVSYLRAFDSL